MHTARFGRTSGMQGMAGGARLPDLLPVISAPSFLKPAGNAPSSPGSGRYRPAGLILKKGVRSGLPEVGLDVRLEEVVEDDPRDNDSEQGTCP